MHTEKENERKREIEKETKGERADLTKKNHKQRQSGCPRAINLIPILLKVKEKQNKWKQREREGKKIKSINNK